MSGEIFLLIIIFLFVMAALYWSQRNVSEEVKSFLGELVLPLTYDGDLYWIQLHFQDPISKKNERYNLIFDTGSELITLPSQSCVACAGPRWSGPLEPGLQEKSYQGGQRIHYQFATAVLTELGRLLQVAVMVRGSNPDGKTVNLFGLMHPGLHLETVVLDFPRNQIQFLPGPSEVYTTLRQIPYWAIPVQGVADIDWIILDSGTNFVLVDPGYRLHAGFQFNVGAIQVQVPSNLIRKKAALVPRSIILGNFVMRKYCWTMDLRNMTVGAR